MYVYAIFERLYITMHNTIGLLLPPRMFVCAVFVFHGGKEYSDPLLSVFLLTLLHSERPKLYTILAFLSAIGLINAAFIIKTYTHFLSPDQKVQGI